MRDEIRFALRSRVRRFVAEGLDVPISAEAPSIPELRRLLAEAAFRFLGHDTRIILLVGVRRGPHVAQPVHAPVARSLAG
jgi:hypothetical protein